MASTSLIIHEIIITNQKKEIQSLRDFDNGNDLHKFLCDQLYNWNTKNTEFEILNDRVNKKLLRVIDEYFDPLNDKVQGVVESGGYGQEYGIINDLGETVYNQESNEAPMMPFYFCFYIPKNSNKGYLVLQSFRGNGIKTLLNDQLRKRFKNKHPDFSLRVRPIIQSNLLNEILNNSIINKITFRNSTSNQPVNALADKGQKLPALHTEYSISSKWKADNLYFYNTIKDFFNKKKSTNNLLVFDDFEYNQINLTVNLNGKERKIHLHKLENTPAVYDVSDKVSIETNGFPKMTDVKAEVLTLINDIIEHKDNER